MREVGDAGEVSLSLFSFEIILDLGLFFSIFLYLASVITCRFSTILIFNYLHQLS